MQLFKQLSLILLTGVWMTPNEKEIHIKPCGEYICGYSKKGTKILFDFDKDLKGMIVNPMNQKSYDAKIKIIDENKIEIEGCYFIFCKKQIWERKITLTRQTLYETSL